MKKLLTILLAALLCVCCVSMVACKEEAGVEGTYKMYSVTISGTTYEVGDTIPAGAFMGNPVDMVLAAEYMSLELNKDGTAVSKMNGEVMNNEITWSKSGNTITITYNGGGSDEATLNGNELSMVTNSPAGEMTYVLKKA